MDSATAEEVLLDENREAEGHNYFDLGGFQASAVFLHCHRLFCILLSSASQEQSFCAIQVRSSHGIITLGVLRSQRTTDIWHMLSTFLGTKPI